MYIIYNIPTNVSNLNLIRTFTSFLLSITQLTPTFFSTVCPQKYKTPWSILKERILKYLGKCYIITGAIFKYKWISVVIFESEIEDIWVYRFKYIQTDIVILILCHYVTANAISNKYVSYLVNLIFVFPCFEWTLHFMFKHWYWIKPSQLSSM